LLLKLLAKIRKRMQGKNFSSIVLISIFFLSSFMGMAQQNQADKMGRKQGKWVKYQDGVKLYEGQFIDGYPNGTFLRYYKSGRLKSKTIFSQQGKRSLAEFYYDNRHQQIKAKGLYVNKAKDSLWLLYAEDGVLISEENYKKGIPNGLWKLYDYRGVLVKETPYKEGKINGQQKEYFDNAQVKRLMNFKMDTISGNFKVYYPSGEIYTNGYFVNGLQDSLWSYYLTGNKLWFTETYEDGELLKRVDPSGKAYEVPQEQDTVKLDIDPSEIDIK